MEIYNEQGFDLLDPSHETKQLTDLPRVKMMEDENGNFHLKNLSMHRAGSEEDALNLLFLGDTNRAISETAMNQASSRSHCMFTIFLEGRRAGSDRVLRSKLHMVDLAGSERVHKTKSDGVTLREAQYINTSLFYLEMVIVALNEKKGGRVHIPYRNSMMTSVLRDSLGGNCKTVMVATCSAEKEQTEESISTCRFAQRVALVKNDAHVNEETDPFVTIRRLKGEVATLRAEVTLVAVAVVVELREEARRREVVVVHAREFAVAAAAVEGRPLRDVVLNIEDGAVALDGAGEDGHAVQGVGDRAHLAFHVVDGVGRLEDRERRHDLRDALVRRLGRVAVRADGVAAAVDVLARAHALVVRARARHDGAHVDVAAVEGDCGRTVWAKKRRGTRE
jgi:hypothetical protein